MEAKRLAGLEPAPVFGYFEEICAIPHGSRNTKRISDYLVNFAREHGLRFIQDDAQNVILFADGTCGMEEHPAVILQGHMDMVCEKGCVCPMDMAGEGLEGPPAGGGCRVDVSCCWSLRGLACCGCRGRAAVPLGSRCRWIAARRMDPACG